MNRPSLIHDEVCFRRDTLEAQWVDMRTVMSGSMLWKSEI